MNNKASSTGKVKSNYKRRVDNANAAAGASNSGGTTTDGGSSTTTSTTASTPITITAPTAARCKNTCDAESMAEKQRALAYHRNIQAGLRTRTEITEAFRSRKNSEVKLLEKLKTEYKVIDNMLFQMLYLLSVRNFEFF